MNRVAAWNQVLTGRALDGLGRHRRDHHLRAARRGPAHLAGRVQPGRPGSGRRRAGAEPGRDRVAGRLPLRDAGPSRARADPARQLPPELLPVQHPRRGRPGRGRGGRDRGRPRHPRPRHPRPRHPRPPVPLLAGRAAPDPARRSARGQQTGPPERGQPAGSPRAAPGGIGMSIMPCPGCGAPAEITERFILASTDGPITHVAVCCIGGHHYRMEADRLPADRSQPPAPRPPAPHHLTPRPPFPSLFFFFFLPTACAPSVEDGPRPESVMSGTPARHVGRPRWRAAATGPPAPALPGSSGRAACHAWAWPPAAHLPALHSLPGQSRPDSGSAARAATWCFTRPWCLSCCQDLDRERCDMTPFGG